MSQTQTDQGHHRVVVTGYGTVSALGADWPTVAARLAEQRSAVRYMNEWDQYADMATRLAAPVDAFSLPAKYTRKRTRSMGRVAQMAVLATEKALLESGLQGSDVISNGQTGIAYGSATGSSAAAVEFFHLLENQTTAHMNSSTYIRMMSHTAAVNISVYFGTRGRMITTSSACTAGSQGIGYAYEAIKYGQQAVMIAGGAEELCPTQAAVFDTVSAASVLNSDPEKSPRPFDQDRDGLVLGEGATTLILESLVHAQARGAPILAEVVGFATNTDGTHLVKPNQEMMAQVMRDALADARLAPDAVGYISAHGTATEQGDIAESLATEAVMGSNIPISSLKSYTGHSLGACGAFEAWVSAMMMREGWFAPTLNLERVDERCGALDHIRGEARELSANVIMSNNFAFGGINTSLILKKYPDI